MTEKKYCFQVTLNNTQNIKFVKVITVITTLISKSVYLLNIIFLTTLQVKQ